MRLEKSDEKEKAEMDYRTLDRARKPTHARKEERTIERTIWSLGL
jgi:hypothetical protein